MLKLALRRLAGYCGACLSVPSLHRAIASSNEAWPADDAAGFRHHQPRPPTFLFHTLPLFLLPTAFPPLPPALPLSPLRRSSRRTLIRCTCTRLVRPLYIGARVCRNRLSLLGSIPTFR